jgi:choline kinase
MRAIVLSAGQGKRLLPLTLADPKCLLAVDGEQSVLDVQLRTLARCGIERATVLIGFGAAHVEAFVASNQFGDMKVDTLFNPFYSVSDNLATCWMARSAMTEDFLLLNGDTLFEDELLRRVLKNASAPVNVTIDHKSEYDDDDMKVTLDADKRLRAIGKKLPALTVDGESIGMLVFRGDGVPAWRDALEHAMRETESLKNWYLSVVNDMAQTQPVATVSIEGCWWAEIDCPEDLADVRCHYLQGGTGSALRPVAAGPPI